jgi:hypothetical protein
MAMFIPASLRYGIGSDYFSYKSIFYGSVNPAYSLYDISRVEPGYIMLNKVIYNLGFGYQWIFVVMSFLTLFFLMKSSPREYAFLIIPFYFLFSYLTSYNVMRQALAMTMGFYAYTQFDNKRYIKSMLILIFAFFFHKSAIMYPILFLFGKIFKINKVQSVVLYIVIFLIAMRAESIMLYFADTVIPGISSIYASQIKNDAEGGKIRGVGTYLRYVYYLFFLVFVPVRKDRNTSTHTLLLVLIFVDVIAMFSFFIIFRLVGGLAFVMFLAVKEIYTSNSRWRNVIVTLVMFWAFFDFCLGFVRDDGKAGATIYQAVPGIEYFYLRD